MAVSQQQKVDFLLKKLGFTKTKTGLAVDSTLTGTKKAGFAEAIPSPLIIANSSVWNEADSIPATPPGSDTNQVRVYLAASSGHRMTVDSTVASNRAFIAFSTYNDTSSTRLNNWIDTQFGAGYLIKVFKGDPNSGGVQLSAAGSGANDGWFFDYSAGVLNFNDTNVPSGVTGTNIYVVGYRYIGQTGAPTSGISTFSFLDLSVERNLDVGVQGGISTFRNNINADGIIEGIAGENKIPFLYSNLAALPNAGTYHGMFAHVHSEGRGYFAHAGNWLELVNKDTSGNVGLSGDLDVDGHTNLDNVSIAGVSTFAGAIDLNADLDVDGHTNLDNVSIAGVTTITSSASSALYVAGRTVLGNNTNLPTFNAATQLAVANLSGNNNFVDMTILGGRTGRSMVKFGDQDNKETGSIQYHHSDDSLKFFTNASSTERLIIKSTGNIEITNDLDVDGHTNLDNVSIAGFTTITQDLDVDGHTNLDNVSIAGVSTFTGNVSLSGDLDVDGHTNLDNVSVSGVTTFGGSATFATDGYFTTTTGITIENTQPGIIFSDTNANPDFIIQNRQGSFAIRDITSAANRFLVNMANGDVTVTGNIVGDTASNLSGFNNVTASGDLDVDGHTNLDNVSIAGVTTTAGNVDINANLDAAGTVTLGSGASGQVILEYQGTTRLKTEADRIDAFGHFNVGGNVDNALLRLGASNDLVLTHDGDQSFINNLTSNLNINAPTVVVGTGLSVAGVSTFVDLDVDGHAEFDAISVSGVTTSKGIFHIRPSSGALSPKISYNDSIADALIFVDNVEARFGTSSDLKIYHNGSHSIISNKTGNLKLEPKEGEKGIVLLPDAQVELYYDNEKRLETSSVGVNIVKDLDVDGHTNLDNLSVAGVSTFTGDATFIGNVSIGGTLTYEDVKNVDAVGLITARSGIRVLSDVIEAQAGENKIPSLYADLAALPSASTYHGMFAHVHATGRGYFAHAGNWLELVNKDTSGNVGLSGDLDVDGHTNLDNVSIAGVTTATGLVGFGTHITLQDYAQIRLGEKSGGDFFISHNPTLYGGVYNELISTNGNILLENRDTGANKYLYLKSDQVSIRSYTGNEAFITCSLNSDVKLWYDNVEKLATTNTGINVTGNVVSDGLVIDGDSDLNGDLDVDGHTNLDNVSIAGVTTMSGNLTISNATPILYFIDTGANPDYHIKNNNGYFDIVDGTNAATRLSISNTGELTVPGNSNFNAGIDVTGNANVSGDLDVDGHTNLDNVSVAGVTTFADRVTISGGKDLFMFDNGVIRLGNNSNTSDFQMFHDGSHSRLNNATGTIYIQNTSTGGSIALSAKSGQNGIVIKEGPVRLYYDNTLRISTSGVGATVYGNLDVTADIDVDGHTNLDNVSVAGVSTFSDHIHLKADGKHLYIGSSDDFSIQHNGNNTFLDNGEGQIYIRDDQGVNITNLSNQSSANFYPSDGVYLYYVGNQKLRTTNTGITVTGTVVATGADINGDIDVDGHTNLDNVNIAGVTTFTGAIDANGDLDVDGFTNLDGALIDGGLNVVGVSTFNNNIQIAGGTVTGSNTNITGINSVTATTFVGNGDFVDIDVDGHTELDNVNVVGIATITSTIGLSTKPSLYLNTTASTSFIHSMQALTPNMASGHQNIIVVGKARSTKNTAFIGYKYSSAGSNDNLFTINHWGANELVTVNGQGDTTIAGGLDVDGHTNLDNVSVAGVTTFANNLTTNGTVHISSTAPILKFTETDNSKVFNIVGDSNSLSVRMDGTGGSDIIQKWNSNGTHSFYNTVGFVNDIDVDGHTNLDNVSVAGITTFANNVHAANVFTSYLSSSSALVAPYADIDDYVDVGSNIKLGNAGIITATTFKGDGDFVELDVDGHTNLDNVSITGVTTFANYTRVAGQLQLDSTLKVGGATGTSGQYLKSTGSGVAWESFPTARTSQAFTASSGQTTFSFSYTVGLVDVFVNGIKLSTSEFTATNGSSVVLAVGCFVGDIVEILSYNVASGVGGGLSNIVEDTTPQLGGNLDLFNKTINGTGNINITGVATATKFVGDGSGLTGVTASGSGVIVKDSGSTVGTAQTIDFGTNLSLSSISAGIVTVTASGGSGSGISTISGVVNIANDLDVDGHTNLDNVSVAGVTTISNDLHIESTSPRIYLTDTNHNSDWYIGNSDGDIIFYDTTLTNTRFRIYKGNSPTLRPFIETPHTTDARFDGFVRIGGDGSSPNHSLTVGGNSNFSGISTFVDIDVDGHTNLDNVSIAGVTTFGGAIGGTFDLNGDLDVDGHTELDNVNIAGVVTATTFKGAVQATSGTFSSNIDANGDLDVDGHTNLDNLSVAGVSTFTGKVAISTVTTGGELADTHLHVKGGITFSKYTSSGEAHLPAITQFSEGGSQDLAIGTRSSGGDLLFFTGNVNSGTSSFGTNANALRLRIRHDGKAFFSNDLDVDGHTELDNTNIVGIVTVTNTASGTGLKLIDSSSKQFAAGGGGGGSPFAGSFTNHDFRIQVGGSQNAIFKYAAGSTGNFELGPSSGIGITFNGSTGNAGYAGIITATKFVGDGSGLTGITASGSGVVIKHDGSTVGTAGTINFSTNLDVSAISAGIVTITASGGGAAGLSTDAYGNTFGGHLAGNALTSGNEDNVLIGREAGEALNASNGDDNVFIGAHAGEAATSHRNSVLIGYKAGSTNQTGYRNVVIGDMNFNSNGNNQYNTCTFVGYGAGSNVQTGYMEYNTFIGYGAGQSSGADYDVCIGRNANNRGSGRFGIFIGDSVGNPFGTYGDMSGQENIMIGRSAGGAYTSGGNNTLMGSQCGGTLTTGSNNLVLGHDADVSGATVSNEITLGDTNITKFRVPGINVVLKDNGGTPTQGHVLTVDANGEASFAAASGGSSNVGITTNLSGSFTASAGSASTINTFGYGSGDIVVEYTVFIKNGSNFQSQKLLAMRDGTTIHSTQFAVMYSSSLLVQLDATISSGNILLRATPETGVSGSTTYKIKREVM